ncbi:MAG: phage portal protein [Alistipes sp.]|nr:phage portal protein [Alistipes sp.]
MSKTTKICGVTTSTPDPYSHRAAIVESREFWRWGNDNHLPDMLSQISRCSTTHRRIINDKADYISGKGFAFDSNTPLLGEFIKRVNGNDESLRQVINKIAFDKALFGNAFLEIVTNPEHTFLSLYHQDAIRCRVAKQSKHILLHHTWKNVSPSELISLPLYPNFEKQADGTLRSIVHYKDYEPGFEHYGVPAYIAGLGVSAIAYKTDRWNISRLDNSFQPSGIMILDETVDNEYDAERMMRNAEARFSGKPGQVMFIVKDGSDKDNSRFVPLSNDSDGDWKELHEQATNDIVVAHSWFRSLSGLNYSSSFDSERILHEYEIALNTVILGEQAELLEPIVQLITSTLGIDASSLEFINRPPTRSKPIYMKVWEARKADGLEYDTTDPTQQLYLSEISKYNVTKIG